MHNKIYFCFQHVKRSHYLLKLTRHHFEYVTSSTVSKVNTVKPIITEGKTSNLSIHPRSSNRNLQTKYIRVKSDLLIYCCSQLLKFFQTLFKMTSLFQEPSKFRHDISFRYSIQNEHQSKKAYTRLCFSSQQYPKQML